MTYIVGIRDQGAMDSSVMSAECGHKHRTLTGAVRCLNKLAEHYSDGSHNGWAHFGRVRHADGSEMSYQEQETASLLYNLPESQWSRYV